jgi:predicted phage baseplate assembly protein
MREALAASDVAAVRALAQHGPDEPAITVLDAWALVADTVSFYTERIATEGFLRTATELYSVRELARMLGYELRPGVAAQAELAFTVESAPGAPELVTVLAGTPVQTVPAAGQLPQTFETAAELQARAVWNAIPAFASQPQEIGVLTGTIWVRGTGLGLRPGDAVVVVGAERRRYGSGAGHPGDGDRWLLRTVTQAVENPDGLTGWTRLDCPPPPLSGDVFFLPQEDVEVVAFTERANLFGWNAPDPGLFATGTEAVATEWASFGVLVDGDSIELDGEHPQLLAGSWLVLACTGLTQLYLAEAVTPDGAARYALSGRITRVRLDITDDLETEGDTLRIAGPGPARFDRRTTIAYARSRALPAAEAPRLDAVSGDTLDLVATDPPLPAGRAVLVSGEVDGTGQPAVETCTVVACTLSTDGTTMTVALDPPLANSYHPQTLRVLGNVVTASHGETVSQVLGSGDGRVAFAQFTPSRTPLTHLRATTPEGVASTLVLRVDGVAWSEVSSLDTAAPGDRAYVLKHDENGAVRVGTGDGTHGARLTTGIENVTCTYRVGIGADGAATAGQLSLLPRRPLGIRSVTNPAPGHDWAPPEELVDARRNAPLRTRTLDRAVSIVDHEDFAASYAGVGLARADAVWDGHRNVVTVSVLGTGALPVSTGLLTDLRAALDRARDVTQPLAVVPGSLVWFGVRVDLLTDPAYLRASVEEAVLAALGERLAHAARGFATAVTAAEVLAVVVGVAGVVACTMPRLVPLPDPAGTPPLPGPPATPPLPGSPATPPLPGSPGTPPLPADRSHDVILLPARPARFHAGAVRAAELLGLAPGGVELGEMVS